MAFDAHNEDWQRMGLRLTRTLDPGDPFGSVRAVAGFGRRFSRDRDSLPQTDADRAFHLVAQAAEAIDYDLPFEVEEARAAALLAKACKLLEEAVQLDAGCHDASRMLAAQDRPTFEGFYRFLADDDATVRRDCERARAAVEASDAETRKLACELAFAPYLRWLANEASRALICGRYRKAAELSLELSRLDEAGTADAGLTLALAYAKLEDDDALAALTRKSGGPLANAWLAIANLAARYHGRDMDGARALVGDILAKWPFSGLTLSRQDELPDGVFSRIVVEGGSENELILAVSEATVLLQEGRDAQARGSMGGWLASQPQVIAAAEREEAEDARRSGEERSGRSAAASRDHKGGER